VHVTEFGCSNTVAFYLRREFFGILKACICLKLNGRGERI
jgi:hypothetical protein